MALMSFREPNQVRWTGARPAHRGTQILKWSEKVNGSTTIHTVTAGKTLYLTSLTAFVQSTAAATAGSVWVRDTLGALVSRLVTAYFLAAGSGSWALPYPFPLEIPAGYDIIAYSSAATVYCGACIAGWEE